MSRMTNHLKSLVGLNQQNGDTNVSNGVSKTESSVEEVDDGSKYLIPDEDNRESNGVNDLIQFFGSLKLEEKCVTNGHSSGHRKDNILKPLIDFKIVTQVIDNNVIEIDGKEQIRFDVRLSSLTNFRCLETDFFLRAVI